MSIIKGVIKETAKSAAVIVGVEAADKAVDAVRVATNKAGEFISTSS